MGISEFFQLPLNRLIFSFLPPYFSYMYLLFLGKIYFWLRPEERRLITENIREVLQSRKPSADLRQITRATFRGIFHHYAEKLFQAYHEYGAVIEYLRKKVHISGIEHIDHKLRQGKGVLLVTAHFGGVEFLPTVLALQRYHPYMVVKFKTPSLKQNLEERAARVGLSLIDADEGNLFFRLVRILRENNILITECDEVDSLNSSTAACGNMFGVPVYTDRSIDLLQRKSGAHVLSVFLVRNKMRGYQLGIEPLETPEFSRGSVAANLLSVLEKYILQYPDQWYQWKNWKRLRASPDFAPAQVLSQPRRQSPNREPKSPQIPLGDDMPGAAA